MVAGTARITMDVMPFALVDADGRISGLNRVGLRRAEIPDEQIRELREAYRMLLASSLPFSEAIERLATIVKFPPGQRLVRFLRDETQRGIAGRRRTKAAAGHTSITE